MTQISYYWQQLTQLTNSLLSSMGVRNYLDILLVAMLIYYATKVIRQTRANSVLKGFIFLLVMMWLSQVAELNTINWLLQQIVGTGTIMLVVLFQPELRRALEQMGRTSFTSALIGNNSGERNARMAEHNT